MSSSAQTRSSLASISDIEKQESHLGTVELEANDQTNAYILPDVAPATCADVEIERGVEEEKKKEKPRPGPYGFGAGLPPSHPMHPSQFSGDRFERTPLLTLLGSFCVMVSSLPKAACHIPIC